MRLGGVSEVADELDVSPQRLAKLRVRSGFPEPVADLSAGPVWDLDGIARWKSGRRGPGRPSKRVLGERFERDAEPIGSGGFADVYRANDLHNPGEIVAVKLLRSVEIRDAAARFQRELEILADIEHPNIIPVIAFGADADGFPWYAMPLAAGSLHDELSEIGDNEATVLKVLEDVAAGLDHLHSLDPPILHRDLTPRNILRTQAGHWAISDFGLARQAEIRSTALTKSSQVFGQVFYMAPEQLEGLRNAEIPADIYALGRTLHAMIVGRDPGLTEDAGHLTGTFHPVVRRATKREPSDRYESVSALLDDVRTLAGAPSGPWESPEERLQELLERIPDENDPDEVAELIELAFEARTDHDLRHLVSKALAYLDADTIEERYREDPREFREVVKIWADTVAEEPYGFNFCDVLANFGRRACEVTGDDEILASVIAGLTSLGCNHNRWHVQGTVTGLLQQVRTPERALVAVEALRAAPAGDVAWTLGDFAIRSLHPVLRKGVRSMLPDDEEPS